MSILTRSPESFDIIDILVLDLLFNRRSKYVRPQEKKMWEDIGAGCMSEESDNDDQGYMIHRPSWRSQALVTLINNLDRRDGIARSQQDHPPLRRTRIVGGLNTSQPPSYLPSWAVLEEFQTQADNSMEEDEIEDAYTV